MTEHEDGLPRESLVRRECELLDEYSKTGIYECSDEAIGCSVEEWYPEFETGYYIVDMEYGETLDHTPDEKVARAFALGYDRGSGRPNNVPLFKRDHDAQLSKVEP